MTEEGIKLCQRLEGGARARDSNCMLYVLPTVQIKVGQSIPFPKVHLLDCRIHM